LLHAVQPVPRLEQLLGQVGSDLPLAFFVGVPKAQGEFALAAQFGEQLAAEGGYLALGEFNAIIEDRMMGHTLERAGVVVEEPIDVIEPDAVGAAALQIRKALDMALAKVAGTISGGGRRVAEARLHELGQPLEEEGTIDEDGDAAYPHAHSQKNNNHLL